MPPAPTFLLYPKQRTRISAVGLKRDVEMTKDTIELSILTKIMIVGFPLLLVVAYLANL